MSESKISSVVSGMLGLGSLPTLDAWLRGEAEREDRRPDLFQALLTDQPMRYARYRLGFMLLRLLLRSALHALEMYFLSLTVPFEYFAPLLTYRAAGALIGSSYWGALEPLRASIRELVGLHHFGQARKRIEAWLALAVGLAVLSFLGLFVSFGLRPAIAPGFTLIHAYGVACFLRLGIELWGRTYHAGIFALRRVYRPLVTLVVSDVIELGVIVAGFSRWGAWSIPFAIVVTGLVDGALTFYYVRKAYHSSRLPAPHPFSLRALGRVSRTELLSAGQHALANATMHIDGLVLIALAHAAPAHRGQVSFAMVFYVLRPLMAAAQSWTRLFYFDLQLVQRGAFRVLEPRLLRFLSKLALGWALGCGVLVLGLSRLLFSGGFGVALLFLLPLFVARALFSLRQLHDFVAGRLTSLAKGSVVIALCVIGLSATHLREDLMLVAISVLLVVGLGWMRRSVSVAPAAKEPGLLGLPAWLAALRAHRGEVQVIGMRVDREVASVGRAARALVERQPRAYVTRAGRAHLLMFMASEQAASSQAIMLHTAGAIGVLWRSGPSLDGLEALRVGQGAGLLPAEVAQALHEEGPSLSALVATFNERFGSGVLLELGEHRGALAAKRLSQAALRWLVHEIDLGSHGTSSRAAHRAPLSMAVYAPGGVAQKVFVLEQQVAEFRAFRRAIQLATLRDSLHGV